MNIFCALYKAKRYVIDVLSEAVFNIFKVFRSKNVTTKVSVRKVNTLLAHKNSVVFYAKLNGSFRSNLNNCSTNFSVKNVDWLTNFYLFSKVVLNRKSKPVVFSCMVKDNFVTSFHRCVFVKHTKTNLWTLKVLKNSHWLTNFCACFADPTNLIGSFVVVTVTKVKTKAVYTRGNKIFNHFRCTCDWTKCCENFCTFKDNCHS